MGRARAAGVVTIVPCRDADVIRKALRIATALGLLIAAYAGYTRLFAVAVARLAPPRAVAGPAALPAAAGRSAGAREAEELAVAAFGPGHWSTTDLIKRYYNVERGYWMYAGDYKRSADGKRVEFRPFAVVLRSRDDATLKVLSGQVAYLDFDQPFNLVKSGPKPRLKHVRIEGEVGLSDDRGTPADPKDDLRIKMPYVEFFDEALEIRSESQVELTDRDTRITGFGLRMALRPSAQASRSSTGAIDGVEMITLAKDVKIAVEDVGSSGLLPGTARPEQQRRAAGAGATAAVTKTPFWLECAGPMEIRLPTPRRPVRVGPPPPPRPTLVDFSRAVVVKRGAGTPDRLDGDHLRAVLMPIERPATAKTDPDKPEPKPAAGAGPLTDLALTEARVIGHAVWLQSDAKGINARGNELIFKKPGPDQPDETYFRADPGKRIWLEKLETVAEGPDRGKVTTVTTVWAADATIHGDQADGGRKLTVVARGPGLLESRPGRDKPVERSATWRDQLVMRPVGSKEAPCQLVTLSGSPRVDDPARLTMTARDSLILWLAERPGRDPVAGAAPAAPAPASESYRVEWMTALGDVHLAMTQGERRELTARERLDVIFTEAEGTIVAPPAAPAAPPAGAPPAGAVAPAAAPAEEAGPTLDVAAGKVWARVELRPSANGKGSIGEVREARFRDDVAFRQQSRPGKAERLDVDAMALDLLSPAEGRTKVEAQGKPARVTTDEFSIEGPALEVDQSTQIALVRGDGRLWGRSQGDGGGLLGGIRPATAIVALDGDDTPLPVPDKPGQPFEITWTDRMEFHGSVADDRGRPGPARAYFVGDVRADLGDDLATCGEMEALFDRPVSFAGRAGGLGVPRAAAGEDKAGDGRPEVVAVICRGDVDISSLKLDAQSGKPVGKQQIHGELVSFDKPSRTFWVEDEGVARIYGYDDGEKAGIGPAGGDIANGRSRRRPVVDRGDAGRARSAPPKLSLTRIQFRRGMDGALGPPRVDGLPESREATFRGNVDVLRGPVADFEADLSRERLALLPPDFVSMTSRSLRVENVPATKGSGAEDRNLLKALGDAQASTADSAIVGDYITYDSRTGLFYIQGTNIPVQVVRQDSPGQPISCGSSKILVYNPKTGESQATEPGSFALLQPKTGLRPGRVAPPGPEKPAVKKPKPRLKPRLNDIENKGFRGQ